MLVLLCVGSGLDKREQEKTEFLKHEFDSREVFSKTR